MAGGSAHIQRAAAAIASRDNACGNDQAGPSKQAAEDEIHEANCVAALIENVQREVGLAIFNPGSMNIVLAQVKLAMLSAPGSSMG